jgi:hypothetical protein
MIPDHIILDVNELGTAHSELWPDLSEAERRTWERYNKNKSEYLGQLAARLLISEWAGDPPVPLWRWVPQPDDVEPRDTLNVPASLRHSNPEFAELEDRMVVRALNRLAAIATKREQVLATLRKLIVDHENDLEEGAWRHVSTVFPWLEWQAFVSVDDVIDALQLPDGTYLSPDLMHRMTGCPREALRRRLKERGLKARGRGRPKKRA